MMRLGARFCSFYGNVSEVYMEFSNLFLFIGSSLLLIVAPGPDSLYVLSQGITSGRKIALLTTFGVILGLLVHTMGAALGVSLLIQRVSGAFFLIRLCGGVYLLYLGIKMFRSRDSLVPETVKQENGGKAFFRGLVANVLNPKIALFFLAYLPQFVNPCSERYAVQLIMLGTLFALLSLVYMSLLAVGAGKLGRVIGRYPERAQRVQMGAGGIISFLGIQMALGG